MVLGTTFLRQFTGSFDLNSKSIALAPSITSADGSTIGPIVPTPDPVSNGLTLAEIVGIAAAGFLLLIIIIAICIYCVVK